MLKIPNNALSLRNGSQSVNQAYRYRPEFPCLLSGNETEKGGSEEHWGMCFPGEITAMPLTSLAMLLQVWIETGLWSHL